MLYAYGELPIVQYWHGHRLPADIAELTATFRDQNPDQPHLIFSEATAEVFIAEHFTHREVAAFRACAVPAMQADYFRYCAILALGGICSDVDFRCVRPFKDLLGKTNGGMLFERANGVFANGMFLFANPGHPLLQMVIDLATVGIERQADERVWWVTGPWLFTILWRIRLSGSLDAARQFAVDHGVSPGKMDACLNAVGDYSRVLEAFKGVRVASFAVARRWVAEPELPPQYKRSKLHWVNWQKQGRTIFR
jgi:glycosyl transferase-like sugar-binding protein